MGTLEDPAIYQLQAVVNLLPVGMDLLWKHGFFTPQYQIIVLLFQARLEPIIIILIGSLGHQIQEHGDFLGAMPQRLILGFQ